MGKLIMYLKQTLLIICLLVGQFVPVYAAQGSLYATSTTGKPGDTVTVSIVMNSNPGLVSMAVDVDYDKSVLTLVSVSDNGLLSGAVHSNNMSLCPYRLSWANDLSTENFTVTGTLATLTFKINENAADGTYSVKPSYTPGNADILDKDVNEISFLDEGR